MSGSTCTWATHNVHPAPFHPIGGHAHTPKVHRVHDVFLHLVCIERDTFYVHIKLHAIARAYISAALYINGRMVAMGAGVGGLSVGAAYRPHATRMRLDILRARVCVYIWFT